MDYECSPKVPTPPKDSRSSGIFIGVACLAALAGCIAQTSSIFMYNWWESGNITYNYHFKGVEKQHLVGPTEYGLESIKYDGGRVIVSWKQRIERSKTKGYNAIQYNTTNENEFEVFASHCPPSCQEAIATRITGYETIKSMNDVIKLTLIICSVLVVLSVIWPVFFGRHFAVSCIWFAAAAGTVGVSYVWYYRTYESWNTIVTNQQMPRPVLGNGFYLSIVGAGLYIAAGIGFLATIAVSRFLYHHQVKKFLKGQYSELLRNDIAAEANCNYSFSQSNQMSNGINGLSTPAINTPWSSQSNVIPFTQPNSNGFWNGPQSNFIPPGI